MVCPFCFQLGTAAASYELDALVKRVSKRHPKEGVVVGIIGAGLLIWLGPKLWKVITE
jgi:hypothetical protein